MAALDSTSTDQEVFDAYDDNASYAEDDSVAKARAFQTACRIILRRRPRRAQHGSEEIELDLALIAKQLDAAGRWLAAKAGGRVRHASMADFRR